ncbi:Oidioi.mRNA.OKI2018_I69.PAR.g11949.t1.cds [Oikopleura dioica]|uniref:Oidioi.mRNA.OKI2018_I69.PAR.g11949.t1.cds n=1 Tax=Oikopleura dioica TaxID=34765 RepID=A0ABN7RY51_OIKDI|nr:Oidioi.mRNA.OKI2018_I69.PAR.g11949.t1.cds [Oikopleura dioica]
MPVKWVEMFKFKKQMDKEIEDAEAERLNPDIDIYSAVSPLASPASSDIRLEEIDPDWWNANAHWAIAAIAGIMLLLSVFVTLGCLYYLYRRDRESGDHSFQLPLDVVCEQDDD